MGETKLPVIPGASALTDAYGRRLANQEVVRKWRYEQRAHEAVKALSRNSFNALYVPDAPSAFDAVLAEIPEGARVGMGGSVTIRVLGLAGELARRGHTVYDHWESGLSAEDVLEIRHAHLTCDVFLSSVNALTLNGSLVSTDGVGNRIAAMTFGPKKVVLVVGANKIVENLEGAFSRIREVCAPLALNNLGVETPCAQTGICAKCTTGNRLCRATLILDCRPLETEMTVIVVGDDLGF
jgi:hypothetical protein